LIYRLDGLGPFPAIIFAHSYAKEGALTDADTELFWPMFSKPTRAAC
jgi:hypothetical protein